jgi:hypothetical protein
VAETTPAIQCPSCGSGQVESVALSLIPSKYYECRGCKVTFRHPPFALDRPDLDRFDAGVPVPPGKPGK